jgi:large subunit ribosomal protein L10
MKKAEKEQQVSLLSERLRKATAVILAEDRGLKVSEISHLRKELKKVTGELRVVKNRLALRAVKETPLEGLKGDLKGPTAVATSQGDPVLLSKILTRFAEELQPFKLKSGFVWQRLLTSSEIDLLSKLPSREELYSKLLGILQAPATGLARALQAVPQMLVRAIKEIEKTKGG